MRETLFFPSHLRLECYLEFCFSVVFFLGGGKGEDFFFFAFGG